MAELARVLEDRLKAVKTYGWCRTRGEAEAHFFLAQLRRPRAKRSRRCGTWVVTLLTAPLRLLLALDGGLGTMPSRWCSVLAFSEAKRHLTA